MFAVLQYSFNAVMPIILLIAVGVIARRAGFLDQVTLEKMNRFTFRFAFFAMTFMNIYGVESIRDMPVRMGIFCLLSLTVLFALGFVFSGILTRERFRRGVLIQAMFRSNYAIIGLPVAIALVGEKGGQMAAFLQLPSITFFNFTSVVVLSLFCDYEAQYRLYGEGPLAKNLTAGKNGTAAGKDDPAAETAGTALEKTGAESETAGTAAEKTGAEDIETGRTIPSHAQVKIGKVLKGIVANPLIQGLTAGLICLILRQLLPVRADGEIVFSLRRDIPWLYSPLQSLSRMATPLALVVLGGQLEMKEIRGFKAELAAGILMRLVAAPVIGFALLFAAVRMGLVSAGPVEIAVMVALFASPEAVSSIVMSYEMGGDGHLAGQIVVWTSILGLLSMFVIVFLLRMSGFL